MCESHEVSTNVQNKNFIAEYDCNAVCKEKHHFGCSPAVRLGTDACSTHSSLGKANTESLALFINDIVISSPTKRVVSATAMTLLSTSTQLYFQTMSEIQND